MTDLDELNEWRQRLPPDGETDLDTLMSMPALLFVERPKDLDSVIAYQRKMRAQRESGVKVKKGASDTPKVKLDLAALGLIKKAPTATVRRRI